MAEIESSSALKSAKLNATKALIDAGSSFGKIEFYGGTRSGIDDAVTQTLIVEVLLTKPCGFVDATGLHLTPSAVGQVFNAERITWARVVNSDGTPIFSGLAAQTGDVDQALAAFVIDIADVARGGFVSISTAVIAEP